MICMNLKLSNYCYEERHEIETRKKQKKRLVIPVYNERVGWIPAAMKL